MGRWAGSSLDAAPTGGPVLVLFANAAFAHDESGETLVVSDERGTDPDTTPASVTVVPIDEGLPASADLTTVLATVAGAHTVSLGGLGDYSAVSLRGSTWRQVEIFLDGIPLNPDGSASVNLAEIPIWAFDRVEVYRGNAPPELLASPVGGVVNLVTNDGPAPPSLGWAYGAHDTARIDVAGGAGGERWDVLAFTELFTTEGDFRYFSDAGTTFDPSDDHFLERTNNDKTAWMGQARARADLGSVRLTLADSFATRESGLAGNALYATERARLETLRNLESVEAKLAEAPLSTTVRGWGLHRFETLRDPDAEVTLTGADAEVRTATAGALAHVGWAPSPIFYGAVTTSGRFERALTLDHLDDLRSEPVHREVGTAALSANLHLLDDHLTLSPVVQGSTLTSDAPMSGGPLTSFDPRGGILVGWSRHFVTKANLGRYLRPPDLLELYGLQGTTVGNPDLVPERGLQADIGFRAKAPDDRLLAGTLEVTAFWNEITDLIVFVQNAQRTSFPVNLGEARIQGLETALELSLEPWLTSQTSFTAIHSVNQEADPSVAGNQVPRIPRWDLDQRTTLRIRDGYALGHTWSYVDGNTWDATNYLWAAPRSIHGAFARARPFATGPEIEVDVLNLFDNVTETADRNPLDDDPSDVGEIAITDFAGYPLAGRTWLLHLRFGAP